jgi:Cu-Zn family superoxide dismutase
MKCSRLALLPFCCWLALSASCGGKPTESPPPEAPLPPPPEEAPPAEPEAAAEPEPEPAPPEPKMITVQLQAKSGSKLAGTATLVEVEDGVRVSVQVEGIKPGDHGAHFHEKGDCSAPDAKSAGEHFNPDGHKHGFPDMPGTAATPATPATPAKPGATPATPAAPAKPGADVKERHLGDLGNITVGKDGKGVLEITISGANLKPDDAHSFVNRALIIHEKKDTGGQPAGNAGGRIGCGEIK